MVEVIVTDEFTRWYEDLSEGHQESVFHVVGILEGRGTTLGFPYSSDLKGTKHALRELRVKAQPRRYESLMLSTRQETPSC